MGDELLRSTGGETAAADETGGTQTTDFTDGENVPVQAGRGPKEGRSQKKPKAAKEKPHKEKKPKAAKEKKPHGFGMSLAKRNLRKRSLRKKNSLR